MLHCEQANRTCVVRRDVPCLCCRRTHQSESCGKPGAEHLPSTLILDSGGACETLRCCILQATTELSEA